MEAEFVEKYVSACRFRTNIRLNFSFKFYEDSLINVK